MSKTFFNISEQKTHVINFIKKHKDILVTEQAMNITDEFIGKLVKSNNNEFFRLATDIQLKFGCKFYIFADNCDNQHRMIQLWFPAVFCKVASDKAINEFCRSKSFDDAIATCCTWYNMTPNRWKTFEAIFDFYDKPKTSSKKTTKKTSSKTSTKVVGMTLNDFERLLNDIVFID